MSTFVPDPNLVVEVLRKADNACPGIEAAEALQHAEAIAEMWEWVCPDVLVVQELIASAREALGITDSDETDGFFTALDRLRAALNAFEDVSA